MSNDHQKLSIETDFGQRVMVDRERIDKPLSRECGERLTDIGKRLKGIENGLKVYEYVGSAAVHIYYCKALGRADFICQTPFGNATQELAEKALSALNSDSKVAYGHKRAVKRSGF